MFSEFIQYWAQFLAYFGYFFYIGQKSIIVNSQILKTNLSIWSHCFQFKQYFESRRDDGRQVSPMFFQCQLKDYFALTNRLWVGSFQWQISEARRRSDHFLDKKINQFFVVQVGRQLVRVKLNSQSVIHLWHGVYLFSQTQ